MNTLWPLYPSTHPTGVWVGPADGPDAVKKKKILLISYCCSMNFKNTLQAFSRWRVLSATQNIFGYRALNGSSALDLYV